MDHCQESGCNHDIIPDLTDGNDFGLFLFYKKSTGKIKTSYIAEKSKNYDTNEILIECNAKNLIWTFANEGIYNIYLEIIDNNGNEKNICKNGFVEIK